MRLIDADALMDKMRRNPLFERTERDKGMFYVERSVINAMPTVFAAPVAENLKMFVDIGSNIPVRAHKQDAGLDLHATKGGWIFPFSRRAFDTGVHVAIPEGYVGLLTSKSGLMSKQGITSRGTIDSGYNGSIKAVLFNHSWRFVKVEKGQKITQLVLLPIITPEIELVDSLEDTERGTGGFGSTGKF